MNSRIKELAIQSGFGNSGYIYAKDHDGICTEELEKFAELIIAACDEQVQQYISVCGEIGTLPDHVLKGYFRD